MPALDKLDTVTTRLSYGRWITLHEAREVDAAWFDRHALDKLRRQALAEGKHIRAATFRAGPLQAFRFVARPTGPRQSIKGDPLGRWIQCDTRAAEVFYRTWEVNAE